MSDATVLIPIHREKGNREWLEQAIRSFTPGTPYLVCENDGDIAQAMNDGLARVETEFTVPFGADDIAAPQMVELMVSFAGDADVVYPEMWLVDENLEERLGIWIAAPFDGNRLQTWNFVPGGFLGRTSKLREVGGWRDLETLEDWDLHVRLFRAGARFKPCHHARFFYRQVPGSRNRSSVLSKSEWQRKIVGEPPKVDATFYAQATPAVTYWRLQIPARHLPGTVTTELVGSEVEGHVEFEDHQGAAVFQFPGSKDRAWSIINMRAQGIRTLVETDDNYLDETDATVRHRAGWDLRIGEGAHSVQGHRWCVEQADGVIVTTPTLADIYGELNENVYVCPNSIDLADWPEHKKPDDGVFRIGWFASPSHDKDSVLVRRALSWASRQPGVQVVTIGWSPPWGFDRIHVPWSDDLSAYKKALHILDAGMAPIVRTGWSKCRSDLKVLEYGVAGVLPVVSAEPPYDEWRDTEVRFAHSAKGFEEQIRWCVKNQDEAREQAARLRERVLSTRLIEHQIHKWKEAIAP